MKAHEKAFIDVIAPIIVKKCKEHGWGIPSAIIAQACVESVKDTGLSGLASSCNNFYGMKWVEGCGTDYKAYTTREQRLDGTYYSVQAKFRKYPTIEDGIEGYFKFIEGYKRYKPVMAAKNCTEYARQLKECGWATSISYTNSILNRIKSNGLSIYDSLYGVSVQKPQTEIQKQNYEIGKVYTLNADLYIRAAANGAKVEIDDITPDAKKNAVEDPSGFAILKKGTRVTCKMVKKLTNSVWIQIPSGWICARNLTNIYVI